MPLFIILDCFGVCCLVLEKLAVEMSDFSRLDFIWEFTANKQSLSINNDPVSPDDLHTYKSIRLCVTNSCKVAFYPRRAPAPPPPPPISPLFLFQKDFGPIPILTKHVTFHLLACSWICSALMGFQVSVRTRRTSKIYTDKSKEQYFLPLDTIKTEKWSTLTRAKDEEWHFINWAELWRWGPNWAEPLVLIRTGHGIWFEVQYARLVSRIRPSVCELES